MTAWETNNVALLVHKNRPTGLCRVLEAYSRVQATPLAAKVGLPREDIESSAL